MMIDQCISAVYQRDKKVFLPDFGAIIYSEFNDSIDFNDLLTFDDGKVIEQIQKQESLSEEDARNTLEEYIQDIRKTIGNGKSHYFGGIGYLYKNDSGNYTIEKSKPSTTTSSDESTSKKKVKKSKKKPSDAETTDKINEAEPEVAKIEETSDPLAVDNHEEPEVSPVEDEISMSHENNDEEVQENYISLEETEYEVEEDHSFSTFSTDEKVYNDHGEQENHSRKSNSSKKVFWIALFVILLSVGGFYLYKIFLSSQSTGDKELLTSNEKSTIEENTTKPVSSTEQNNDATKNRSSFESGKEKLKALSNNSQATTQGNGSGLKDDDEQKSFSLILGSFKIERNADEYMRKLQSSGINVDKFYGLNNFFFVGIKKIHGKSNAIFRLEEFRKHDPEAWIYNNALLL